MTPEQYARVCDLFDAAQGVEASRRASFLDSACDDTTLRKEVDALLEHDALVQARQWFQPPFHLEGAPAGRGCTC